MKIKLLLIALLLCCTGSAFASTLIQGNWRWRSDDGDETTATFRAAQNESITLTGKTNVLRLRVRVENPSNDPVQNHTVGALKYSTSPSGPFVIISDSDPSIPAPFVYAHSTVAPDSKASTTNSSALTTVNSGLLYVAGQYFDGVRNLVDDGDKALVSPGKYSDMEFVIKTTEYLTAGTTYYFIIDNLVGLDANNNIEDLTDFTGKNKIASLTTAAVLPVGFISFEAQPVNNSIQLKWSTASEKNNNRFEISRSYDGKTWQVLGSQIGKGNSDAVSSYSLTDNQPLNGVSYYQLAQFDHDETKTVLSIKTVNISLEAAVDVQVFPNPTTKEINVFIPNHYGENISVSMHNNKGKLIHKEQFLNNDQIKKLNLTNIPHAGLYILKINGQGASTVKKIVIL